MSKSFVFNGFCLIVAFTSLSWAGQNDLFSNVRTESVFAPSSDASAKSTPSQRSNQLPELEVKVTSTGELARKLRLVGFEVEEDSANRMVSTKTKLGQWTLPVLIVISETGDELMLAMLLSSVSNEDQIPKAKLLQLLQANRKYAPSSFGYSSKRKRMELYHVVKNQLVSGQKLRDEIDRLGRIAIETEGLWDLKQNTSTETSSGSKPVEASTPGPTLAGKWVATRSATEAFAIQFNADGTFLLAYVSNGKTSQSTGTFTLQAQKLTLAGGSSFRLAGTISSQTEKEFQFQPENSAAGTANLVFQKAN